MFNNERVVYAALTRCGSYELILWFCGRDGAHSCVSKQKANLIIGIVYLYMFHDLFQITRIKIFICSVV